MKEFAKRANRKRPAFPMLQSAACFFESMYQHCFNCFALPITSRPWLVLFLQCGWNQLGYSNEDLPVAICL
jgi:hypothetical protein